jgi:hypothetical protein
MAMGKKLYAGQVPWSNTRPMTYAENWHTGQYQRPDGTIIDNYESGAKAVFSPPIWRDNVPFEGTMTFIGFTRGRSAARFILEDQNEVKYQMFMSDALDLIQSVTLKKGKADGTWAFCKKGTNYGLVRVSKKLK